MHSPTPEVLTPVAQLLADGTITVPVQQTFQLADAAEAMQTVIHGHTLGKISVRIA